MSGLLFGLDQEVEDNRQIAITKAYVYFINILAAYSLLVSFINEEIAQKKSSGHKYKHIMRFVFTFLQDIC